jgi:uncharacterized protein YndB with AHSA1/START domain
MPREFEIDEEVEIHASPDQVWDAITSGPGVDSWFMGRSEIEPHVGGKASLTMGGHTEQSTVTAWEPGRRFAHRSEKNPDGTFMAFEYLIEGRGGSTVVRLVHSGFLGDDWEAEYDALTKGDPMYLQKLAAYLNHFAGRTSSYNMLLLGGQVESARVWQAYRSVLGLSGSPANGDRVHIEIDGLAPADGVVEFTSLPTYVGVRTEQGIYTFMHGMRDTVVVEYHRFVDDTDPKQIEQAWQAWLDRAFS